MPGSPKLYIFVILAVVIAFLGLLSAVHSSMTSRLEKTLEIHAKRFDQVVKELRSLRHEAKLKMLSPKGVTSAVRSNPAAVRKKSRIAILTMNVVKEGRSKDWIYPMSFRNKHAYAKRHNIDLIVEGSELVDHSRDICWSKIPMIREWLPHYEWLMWMDGDAFFMDMERSLESVLDDTKDFIVAKDWNGINLGIFFIKNSAYSFDLLDEIWDVPPFAWKPFQEQGAVRWLTNWAYNPTAANLHLPHFLFPPQKMFNSYPWDFTDTKKEDVHVRTESKYSKGDFIVHFPACDRVATCRTTIVAFYAEAMRKVQEGSRSSESDGGWDSRRVPAVFYPSWAEH